MGITDDILLKDPFEKVSFFLGVDGMAEISFLPKVDLPFPEPYIFRVERTRDVTSTWETVGQLTTNWSVITLGQYTFDTAAESWYRIVLIDSDDVEHPSRAVHAGNNWDRTSFVIARDICRRKYAEMRIHGGSDGWLFRKRTWGEVCTQCGNQITGQPVNSDCPVCFGVGLLHGYHDPYPLFLQLAPYDRKKDHNEQGFANSDNYQQPCTGVYFPHFQYDDVWVERSSGRRFQINQLSKILCAVRNIPLIVATDLQAIETTNIVYGLRTPDEQRVNP